MMECVSGVYIILHKASGRAYVGKSANKRGGVCRRIYQHVRRLIGQRHHNQWLQRAWNKHGPEAFTFEVLAKAAPEALANLEQYYIAYFKASSGVYNFDRRSAT